LSRNAPTVGFIWASPTRNFAKSATVSGYPAKNFYLTPEKQCSLDLGFTNLKITMIIAWSKI